jgi:hypothetical protein
MTPQALGAMIKRTGITKSASRKGNFYNYHTEGYTLTRQHSNKYTFDYVGRLQMAIRTEAEQERLAERRREALEKVLRLLQDKGIKTELSETTLWITLETN